MSTSQNDLDRLDYYVWYNMGLYLADIIEAENKANGSSGDNKNTDFESMKANYNKQMSSMKKGMTSKIPKM